MSDVGRCIFRSMNILRMTDAYTFYVCVHMFKVIKVNISPSLQSTLDLRMRDHPYDTRGGELYCEPFPREENVRVPKLQVSIYRYMEQSPPCIKEYKLINRF